MDGKPPGGCRRQSFDYRNHQRLYRSTTWHLHQRSAGRQSICRRNRWPALSEPRRRPARYQEELLQERECAIVLHPVELRTNVMENGTIKKKISGETYSYYLGQRITCYKYINSLGVWGCQARCRYNSDRRDCAQQQEPLPKHGCVCVLCGCVTLCTYVYQRQVDVVWQFFFKKRIFYLTWRSSSSPPCSCCIQI